MKLWISKNSEVPVAEQLTTQIMLAIHSGELKPNQKLPSTRELARRFALHSNTVNAAYRDLARRGWLQFRKGSGVYVRVLTQEAQLDGQLQLDQLISAFLKMARQHGFTLAEIRSRVKGWLGFQPPDHFLIIEPEPELRRILLAEIHEATGFPVQGVGLDACRKTAELAGAALVAMYGRADELKDALPLRLVLCFGRVRLPNSQNSKSMHLPSPRSRSSRVGRTSYAGHGMSCSRGEWKRRN